MGALLESTFFSDKIRGTITLFLLVLILGILGMQYLFPKQQKLDPATLTSLVAATETMRIAATNLEQASKSQIDLNDTLKQQLNQMALARNEGYEQLLKQYGLDLTLPGTVNLKLDRVYTPNDSVGSKTVPGSPGAADPAKHVQKPTTGDQGKVNRSNTITSEPGSKPSSFLFKGFDTVSGNSEMYCTYWGSPQSVLSTNHC